jgi:hypothetical protein
MLEYPSIQGSTRAPRLPCLAFEKLDGSNLRWEWQKKSGWCKQGLRQIFFDETTPIYRESIPIFHTKYADEIVKILLKQNRDIKKIVAFTEFFGKLSEFGTHVEDDDYNLVLFDVYIDRDNHPVKPRDFYKFFNNKVEIPALIYEGNLGPAFISDVRKGIYYVNEGVVCKGTTKRWMAKVKTERYIERLKEVFGKVNEDEI